MSTQSNKTASAGGTSICGLLGVAFVVLKLCHVIAWPWLWVLAPFWIPFAIVIVVLAVFLVAVAFNAIANAR